MFMRVTQSMLANNFLKNLNLSTSNMAKIQNQLTTGKKVSKPSDDPVVAVRSIKYNSQIKEIEQYQRNLGMAVKWMDTTDSVIQEANNIFKNIREKLVNVSNGTLDHESRLAIAREMEQLKEQLGSIANTSIEGRYIFAGTKTDVPPYSGGNLNSNINSDKIEVELGKGITIAINMDGNKLFGFEDTDGNNIFAFMDNLISTLNSNGDTSPLLDKLQLHENNFLKLSSELGANRKRVELIESRLEDQQLITTEILSKEEDADIAQVIMNLNMQENVHRAALGTGARIMQPTLMDFLR